jgi:hypothetical protein
MTKTASARQRPDAPIVTVEVGSRSVDVARVKAPEPGGPPRPKRSEGIVVGVRLNPDFTFSGFVEGTSFSAGTALSTTRWSVPGRDLDKAFISAPENFDGIMQVTVTLYSSRQDILETKEVRFEWNTSHKGDKLPVQISPAQPVAR